MLSSDNSRHTSYVSDIQFGFQSVLRVNVFTIISGHGDFSLRILIHHVKLAKVARITIIAHAMVHASYI